MHRNQIQLGIPRFLNIRFVSLLLTIIGIATVIGGLVLIIADSALPITADTARSISFSTIQGLDQILGFPLPINEMINNSITAVGIATSIIGLDLLIVSQGLRAKNKLALWIAMIILALATYFDMVSFLFQGLLGAPTSAPGAIINGLVLYVLLKDRESFTETSTK
jgi:lysylphosphatidylglycerol synthetase-like protein (DUF2156 family)